MSAPEALEVLRRGDGWWVVAKPSGLACHRSELVHDRHTVLSVVRRQAGREIYLVHRLDRAASGCLLIAFDGPTAGRLAAAMQSETCTKTYLALARGFFRWDDPVLVETPMKDDQGVLRDARTRIDALGRSHDPRASLLRAQPETGRYHQVRRHCRDLGHPLIGDHQHGDTRENVRWREHHRVDRLALHAWRLTLPVDGELVETVCPPPADLADVWREQPWWDDARAREPDLDTTPLPLRVRLEA
jgi:tRNA pseudouridine65 synthase